MRIQQLYHVNYIHIIHQVSSDFVSAFSPYLLPINVIYTQLCFSVDKFLKLFADLTIQWWLLKLAAYKQSFILLCFYEPTVSYNTWYTYFLCFIIFMGYVNLSGRFMSVPVNYRTNTLLFSSKKTHLFHQSVSIAHFFFYEQLHNEKNHLWRRMNLGLNFYNS